MLVIPERYRVVVEPPARPIHMPLSAGKQDFQTKSVMGEYVAFMARFPEAAFVVGDSPKRYNLMAIDGLGEDEALRRAQNQGRFMANMLEKLTGVLEDFSVVFYDDLKTPGYTRNLSILHEQYELSEWFKKDVDHRVSAFLSKPSTLEKVDSLEKAVAISKNYYLDELAWLTTANPAGEDCIQIYPGRNPVLENLFEDKYGFSDRLMLDKRISRVEVYYRQGGVLFE